MPTETNPNQEILALLKENNRLLKSMHRHMRAGQIMNLVKIAAAVILIWIGWRIITPYIPEVQKTVRDVQQAQQQINQGAESIQQLKDSIR